MTDAGAYADSMFGLLWLLGYQFSPRISDIGGTRFWRIDRTADYGQLNDLAAHRIQPQRIIDHWDDLLRIAGSLTMDMCHIESVMRTLQRGDDLVAIKLDFTVRRPSGNRYVRGCIVCHVMTRRVEGLAILTSVARAYAYVKRELAKTASLQGCIGVGACYFDKLIEVRGGISLLL
jgi:hypothetical protein